MGEPGDINEFWSIASHTLNTIQQILQALVIQKPPVSGRNEHHHTARLSTHLGRTRWEVLEGPPCSVFLLGLGEFLRNLHWSRSISIYVDFGDCPIKTGTEESIKSRGAFLSRRERERWEDGGGWDEWVRKRESERVSFEF